MPSSQESCRSKAVWLPHPSRKPQAFNLSSVWTDELCPTALQPRVARQVCSKKKGTIPFLHLLKVGYAGTDTGTVFVGHEGRFVNKGSRYMNFLHESLSLL